jgi:transposase
MLQIQKDIKEYEILVGHYKKAQTLLTRERAHAIILSMQGETVPHIAKILLRKIDTVRSWVTSYSQDRLTSIFPKYSGNTNASKLTPEQLLKIIQTIQSNPDTEDGLPSAFWSVSKLKTYLQAEYGVIYESERSYHHLFAVSHYSFKLPEGFDRRRNDELVKARMPEVYKEMQDCISLGYEVFVADECNLSWETEYRRVWLPKGEKTIMRVNRQKIKQHYFGALNVSTKKEELVKLDWQNTKNIIEALREITTRYKDKKLCFIWDNATWHRSKELRALLGKNEDGQDNEFAHIRFIWLPPYSPDYNPQEHVWKVAKQAVKNNVTSTFNELKDIFEKAISGKTFDYQITRI